MNLEKVIFGFFIGDIDRPELHHVYELVADLQLIAAAITWAMAVHITGEGMATVVTSSVVSLSGGALFANIVSVIILIIETVMLRR